MHLRETCLTLLLLIVCSSKNGVFAFNLFSELTFNSFFKDCYKISYNNHDNLVQIESNKFVNGKRVGEPKPQETISNILNNKSIYW